MMYKVFDFASIDDFDKHIELSIPNYSSLTKIFTGIGCEYAQPESTVIDIGCSTGRFLSQMPKADDCEYIGVDKHKLKKIKKPFDIELLFRYNYLILTETKRKELYYETDYY